MSPSPGSVWLDARGTQSAAHSERGVARYVAEHARALVDLVPETIGSIGLDESEPLPASMEPLVGSGLFAWHRRTRAPDRAVPGIYHVMSPFEVTMDLDDVWPPWIREAGSRLVVTLYDVIPLVMRDEYLPLWAHNGIAWLARLGLIRSAHQVLTISRHTANDAMEHLGIPEERLTVVDSAVSDVHSSLVSSKEEADSLLRETLPRIRPGFLLYVGGDDARKNLEGTIRAYAELPQSIRDKHQLVIAFRVGPLRRFELRTFAQPLGIRPRNLELTGFVSDEQLAALYRACDLFIFPSLYEGAGLPILEAMSCGAPVAASRASSIPELLGDLEATFDPADPSDIARCLAEVLETPGKLDALRERSEGRIKIYTWERVARRTIEGYERAEEQPLEDRRPRRIERAKRRRLAMVTPWPPQESEAASYSRALVRELARHAEVDVIVSGDGDFVFDRSLQPDVPLHTDTEFEWLRSLKGYDRCLFVIGSSGLHTHCLEAMLHAPGVVLAHEVQLLPLYRALHRHCHMYDPYWLEGKLEEMYGERLPRGELRLLPYAGEAADGRVPMTREVQSSAERVLVHSRHQAELLRLDRPKGAASTEVVPFGIPPVKAPANGANGDESVVLACSDPAHCAELRAAFEEVSATHPGARLEILRENQREIPAADLAVWLRSDADGGRPVAALGRLIAARVPTIVYDVGWQGELPDPVLLSVGAESDARELAERMASVLDDERWRREIRDAQADYAEQHSFARVAERYAELLGL